MNDKLRQVVASQKTVISEQSSQLGRLQHDLTRTHSTLNQLRAERQCQDTENAQLINTLHLQIHAVSRPLTFLCFCLSYMSHMMGIVRLSLQQ